MLHTLREDPEHPDQPVGMPWRLLLAAAALALLGAALVVVLASG